MHINILDLREAIKQLPTPTRSGEVMSVPVPPRLEATRAFVNCSNKEIQSETSPIIHLVSVKKSRSTTNFWFEWELVV